MKGTMFNIFEEFILQKSGMGAYENILRHARTETKEAFLSAGTYPDTDFYKLVATACKLYHLPAEEAQQMFGRFTFMELAKFQPHFVQPYKSAKNFLLTVDSVIHVEVKKLYPDTYLPKFIYFEPSRHELQIIYISKRKLYSFMEGLIEGVADYFKENIDIEFDTLLYDGEEACRFHLIFHQISMESKPKTPEPITQNKRKKHHY